MSILRVANGFEESYRIIPQFTDWNVSYYSTSTFPSLETRKKMDDQLKMDEWMEGDGQHGGEIKINWIFNSIKHATMINCMFLCICAHKNLIPNFFSFLKGHGTWKETLSAWW